MSTWLAATPLSTMKLPAPNPYIPQNLTVLHTPTPFRLTYQSQVGLSKAGAPKEIVETLRQVNQDRWASWSDFLRSLPNIKPLLEKNRTLIEKYALGVPQHIQHDAHASVWFQPDDRFHQPVVSIGMVFQSPIQLGNAKQVALSSLYPLAVSHALESDLYPARQAGFGYALSFNPKQGMQLDISGYSDQFTHTTQTLLHKLRKLTFTPQAFNAAKDQLLRALQNHQLTLPASQGAARTKWLLEPQLVPVDAQITALQSIQPSDLQNYSDHLYDQTYIQAAIYGNLTQKDVQSALPQWINNLSAAPLNAKQRWGSEVIQLNRGDHAHFRFKSSQVGDSASMTLLQLAQENPANIANASLLSSLVKPQFFETLRTQQQLGYIAQAPQFTMDNTLGQLFLVQSGTYPADLLERRIDQFIHQIQSKLQAIAPQTFNTLKQSTIDKILERPNSIPQMASFLYYYAFDRKAQFDYDSDVIRATESLTLPAWRKQLGTWLDPKTRRSLTVSAIGNAHPSKDHPTDLIPSIEDFHEQYNCPEHCVITH